jgi:hypothetical protein
MVIFAGARCALISPATPCYWDNILQSFQGDGCAPAPVQQCACRHLTDFAGASKPSIPMCSLSDMTSLSFGDIVHKLTLLFEIVIILFGIMNGGAALGYVLDARLRASVIERLKAPEAGFSVAKGDPDCWVWRLQLDELSDELDAPQGTAVALSEVMGIPFARLRAALPDEMLSTTLAAALGRKQAFSRSGMLAAHAARKSTASSRNGRRSSASVARDVEAGAVAAAAVRLEEMVGTALVLGFIQGAVMMNVVELAQHRSAAKRHFAGVRTPNGREFDQLVTDFVTMMGPGACARTQRRLAARASDDALPGPRQHRPPAQVAAARAAVEAHPESGGGWQLGREQQHGVCAGGARQAGDAQPEGVPPAAPQRRVHRRGGGGGCGEGRHVGGGAFSAARGVGDAHDA